LARCLYFISPKLTGKQHHKTFNPFIMKKLIFLLVIVALKGFQPINANNINTYGKSFTFNEKGITFSIFQNGEFDFYLNQGNGVNLQYQTNNINISFNAGYNYDTYLQYDRYGAIIQIQNTPVYYDHYGRVSQVGNIHIKYDNGNIVRLGGLRIYYNNNNFKKYAYYSGYINHYNRYYVYHPYHNSFVKPYYNYRVVSHQPYRKHYKEHRYRYYPKHLKNKYYRNRYHKHRKNGKNKYGNNKSRQRFAAKAVPKKQNTHVTSSGRSNPNNNTYNLHNINRRNYGKSINNTIKNNYPERPLQKK